MALGQLISTQINDNLLVVVIVRRRINRILEATAITADLIDDEHDAEVSETAEGIETNHDPDRNV